MRLFIPFFLPIFFINLPELIESSADKTYETTPFLLTGDSKDGKVSIPYNSPDQCKSYGKIINDPKVSIRSFGIYFLMKYRGGNCDDGLLICYPATLMKNLMTNELETVTNFKVKRIFQVKSVKNDNISLECAEKMGQSVDGNSTGKQWRGIKVYTKAINASDPLSPRELIIETSLTKKKYTSEPGTRQLSLTFGTRTSLFTSVTFSNGQPFKDDDEFGMGMGEQFAQQYGQAPFMAEHVGLWMLGMDMLAWMTEEHVNLHIYRTCACTMEAWFTRPTDVDDPEEPKVATAGGSTICVPKQMDKTFTLPKLKADQLQAQIVFIVLTDAKWENIRVELLHSENGQTTTIMDFTIGTMEQIKVSFPGIDETSVANGTLMPTGAHELRFDIFLLKHWNVIMVNDTQIGQVFWPNEWWKESQWQNITGIRLEGQMLLLHGPQMVEYDTEGNNFNVTLPLSYQAEIKGFRAGSSFLFRFQLLNESNNDVNITFSDVKSIGRSEFTIQITNFDTIALKTFYDEKLHLDEEKAAMFNNTDVDNVFELAFDITKEYYVIMLNGVDMFPNYTNNMPYCYINNVEVQGDAVLLDKPKMNVPSANETEGEYLTKQLEQIVNYGDKIVIESNKELAPGTTIIVKLLHNSPQCSKKFDIVAQMTFEVDAQTKKFTCEHKLSEEELEEGQPYSLLIRSYDSFYLEILLANDSFYGRSTDRDFIKLCDYYKPEDKHFLLPPWAINYIQINNIEVNATIERAKPKKSHIRTNQSADAEPITWNSIKYLQINKLAEDYFDVRIEIPLAKPLNKSSKVNIYFLNQALEVHEHYGAVVIDIFLEGDGLSLHKYYNNQWTRLNETTLNRTEHTTARTQKIGTTKSTNANTDQPDDDEITDETTTNKMIDPNRDQQITRQIDNKQTQQPAAPFKLIYLIIVSKDEFQVSLNWINTFITSADGKWKQLTSGEKVPVQEIQYVTVKHENIDLAGEVEMKCFPPDACNFKK